MKHANNYKDLTGIKVHRLTFIEFAGMNENGYSQWKVRCDCGTEFIVIAGNVTHGSTKSCGCYRKERIQEMNRKRRERKTSSDNH